MCLHYKRQYGDRGKRQRKAPFGGEKAAKAVLPPEMGLVYKEQDTVKHKYIALRIRKDSTR